VSGKLRLAVVRDFRAENWPSMDLCADELLAQAAHADADVECLDVAPDFRRLLGRAPLFRRHGFNADRLLNRHMLLPRVVKRTAREVDAVHIVDHTYAHLVGAAPPGRSGVYCHDLDAFRCLLEPEKETRPFWFRIIARKVLTGMNEAAIVFHNSRATGEELRRWKLVAPERLRHVPLGVGPEFSPVASRSSDASQDPLRLTTARYLLHIGSCIPRKRIDLLLSLFAELRRSSPDLLLVKIGDPWTEQQAAQIEDLKIDDSIRHLGRLPRVEVADRIRGAAAVLIPSDAEGFGLPVIEALACGVAVVASDLPTLREAGGDVAAYAKPGDLAAWVEVTAKTLATEADAAERLRRLAWTAQFTWQRHARDIFAAYRELIGR